VSVSVTTVRTHIRHLFVKLGAHRRTEAVARARDLDLLAPSRMRRAHDQVERDRRLRSSIRAEDGLVARTSVPGRGSRG
jgi:hypothetical protein